MSNVPTITPGPDDSERTPEGATEPYHLSRAFIPHSKTIASKPAPGFPMTRRTQNSRPSVPSADIKSLSAAVSRPASWAALS